MTDEKDNNNKRSLTIGGTQEITGWSRKQVEEFFRAEGKRLHRSRNGKYMRVDRDAFIERWLELVRIDVRTERIHLPIPGDDEANRVITYPCFGHDVNGWQSIHRDWVGRWYVVTWTSDPLYDTLASPVMISGPFGPKTIKGWHLARPYSHAKYKDRWALLPCQEKEDILASAPDPEPLPPRIDALSKEEQRKRLEHAQYEGVEALREAVAPYFEGNLRHVEWDAPDNEPCYSEGIWEWGVERDDGPPVVWIRTTHPDDEREITLHGLPVVRKDNTLIFELEGHRFDDEGDVA